MRQRVRTIFVVGMASVLGMLLTDKRVVAGWMGFRNDTTENLVVQETIVVNGQSKPGRPQRLSSGEAVRDTQCAAGVRKMTIYDARNTNQPLFNGNFACPAANENILYVIKSDARGTITIETVKSPVQPSPPKK